jgi:hypothetical protein
MKCDFLTDAERIELKARHRKEKDRGAADRIKAVLLADKGWTYRKISEALFLDEDRISQERPRIQTSRQADECDWRRLSKQAFPRATGGAIHSHEKNTEQETRSSTGRPAQAEHRTEELGIFW